MAKLSILAGATSQSVNVFIQDSTSTTGAGKTGLAYNTSGLTAYYSFAGANATSTSITLATLAAVNSAYSSGGFKELDSTNMPGWYRLDLPNAVLAGSKGRSVGVHLQGATGMAPLPLEIELTGWNNQDGVHGGMSALPNAAANADGGLPILSSSATTLAYTVSTVTTVTNQLTAAAIATGVWQDATAGDFTAASSIGKDLKTGAVPGASGGMALFNSSLVVPAVLANGLTHGGNTAVLSLQQLTITNSGGHCVSLNASGSNHHAFYANAAGTGGAGMSLNSTNTGALALTGNASTGDLTCLGAGSISADFLGRVLGSGVSISSFAGVGAWVDDASGAALATDATAAAIKAKTDNLPSTPASTTNITGGTITTVTNLTNAPTAGDFTATMKTSLNAATPAATLDMTAAVPLTNTANTVGDCLHAARVQGFGKWVFDPIGLTLSLYESDNSTVAKQFTVDSATSPTSRV